MPTLAVIKEMTTLLMGALFFLSASVAYGDEAQRVNPKFSQAQELHNELANSGVNSETKQALDNRWNNLVREQQMLWNLAGEMDRLLDSGQPAPGLDSYNARVANWENNLDQFSADVQTALAQADKNERIACVKAAGEALHDEQKACAAALFPLCVDPENADSNYQTCVMDCAKDVIGGEISGVSDCAYKCNVKLVGDRLCTAKLDNCWSAALSKNKTSMDQCRQQ